ncbi:AAA family ATPase [Fusobacterium polymorphum]|uniref:AAA family ATPase n=1 Tax=Fusobacterium nucleatum subsp. polymorphum TaxID=76857 RepID=UPI00300BE098
MDKTNRDNEKKFDYTKCKRLMEDIQKSYLEYGKNRIFLIGDELKDLYLRDIRDGYFDLTESIKDYILHNNRFKWFICLSGTKTGQYFEKVKDKNGNIKFLKVEHNDFKPQEIEDSLGLIEHENKIEEVEEANVNIDKADVIDEVIKFLLEEDCKANEEVCLFVEDLDWAAKFYNEGPEGKDSKFIKQIKDFEKLKKHLVIFSIKDKTVFEETYYENLDDKEMITVPKASTEEIEMTLYRLTWKAIKKNLRNININDLALAFSNSKTSLREVIRVFNKKIKIHGQDLKIEHFEFKEKVKEKIYWKDVELNQQTKDKLIAKIRTFKDGKSEEKGILLYGPPGTGKTMIAKAMATEEKLYFLAPKLSELKGEYVGQSAPKIKALFEEARANEPTLIFLDEVDTLFPARDHGDGDSYTKDMVNEFLQQLDGVDTGEQRIIVLAATNREYMIDPAVKSRLGDSIEIPLPTEKEIRKIYNNQFKDELEDEFISLLNQKNKDELIRKSTGMSGRDIKNICESMKKKTRYLNFKLEKNLNKKNEYFKDILDEVFREKMNNIIYNMKNNKGLEVYSNMSNVNNLYGQDVDKIKKELKSYIKEITETTKQRQDREEKNIKKQNGILLYGPPGNGKTELVKNICKENNLIFVGANGKSFVGNTEKSTLEMIENIFEDTYRLSNLCSDEQGVVLFFDEFDSLVGLEMSSTTRGTVLTKISDDKSQAGIRHSASKILLMAATNYYDVIDEAVKRPGRFDGHFSLRNPRKEDAIKIIEETFNQQSMTISNTNILESFYEVIRRDDSEKINILKNLSNDRYEIEDSEIQKIFNLLSGSKEEKEQGLILLEEAKSKYLCSGSSIKTHILKLKRFLYNEGYFDKDKLEVTDELVNKYKER